MKTDISSSLSFLGLSEDSIRIYLACLRLGKAKASDIAKAARVSRTIVYEYLDELERTGLLHLVMESKAKTYVPANPEIISTLMRQHLQEVEGAVPLLMAQYMQTAPERPGLQFYPGIAGIKLVLEEVLNNAKKYYLLFGSIHDEELVQSVGFPFIEDWSRRRIAAGVGHKNLRSRAAQQRYEQRPNNRLLTGSGSDVLREIRLAPEGIRLPTLIYLFDNKVALLSGALGRQYAAILESADLYEGLQSMFNFLWGLSEPVGEQKPTSKTKK